MIQEKQTTFRHILYKFVDLLPCYLRFRRGGGYAALLRGWIRRARPCACAWRIKSHTLTFFSSSFPSLILPNLLFSGYTNDLHNNIQGKS